MTSCRVEVRGYEQWAQEDAVPADSRVRTFHRRLSLNAADEKRVPGAIAFAEHHEKGLADTSRTSRPAWLRLTALPGVRPIGVRRFRLYV
ncbi:hypothetical protein GCM10009837_71510 [Streptomyces durmitorensis]|uniref:Uncharacterized protein n=1 Tax=Streptomyces durmitorensis TaxID=319947 RepID=A0ABY4PU05_9ACTN|nr:hypothetical protein [Streptomyces durmitorensis]UQT57345.1 hypothetical protein M4V62_20805 [Streptomyces durmitorensis]